MKEVTFLNRVPTYPGRVVLTPVSGQANTFDMVRADAPRVEGTPLDKATFESVVHSRLTGRYYDLDITRETVSSASYTTNPIPTAGWVNSGMTKATSGSYIATGSGAVSTYPSSAFDGSDITAFGTPSAMESWLKIELPNAIEVKKVRLYVVTSAVPTVTVEGTNNDSTWTTLLTLADGLSTYNSEYTLTTTGAFKYYRVRVAFTADNTVSYYSFGFTDYTVTTYKNTFTVAEGWPTIWTNGQRAMVYIPSSAVTLAVTSNTINGVSCATILQPNKHYELRYNGSVFVAKEV